MGMESMPNVGATLSSSFLMVILVLCAIGFLLGLMRGFRRSILRLILTIVSIVLAFVVKDAAVDAILTSEVEGLTLLETLTAELPAEIAPLLPIIITLFQILIGIIAFVLATLILHFASWILFFILKFFIPKGKKKGALLGGIVSVIGSLVLSLSLLAPLNGLFVNVSGIATIAGEDAGEVVEEIGIQEYLDSGICKTLTSIGSPIFDQLAQTKLDNGTTVTLKELLDSVYSTVNLASAMTEMQNIDFSEGLNANNISQLKELCQEIDNSKDGISNYVIEVLQEMLDSQLGEEDLGFNLMDFKDASLAQEVEVLESLYNCTLGDDINIENVVDSLSNSVILLTLAESAEIAIELPTEYQSAALSAIDDISNESVRTAISRILGFEPYPTPAE